RGKNIHRSLLLPRLVARLGVGVHGIKAGKLRPALDLADDELFMRSCSAPSSATKASRSCGITTAPSSSQTMMSPGKMAQPPQPIGSCQPTNVSPLTEAVAAVPAHHTGSLGASTPALSRTTPSVTSAVPLRF